MLAQIPTTTPAHIGEWLIALAAVLAIAALVKSFFVRKPPIEAEFVSRIECAKLHALAGTQAADLRREIKDLEVGVRTELRLVTVRIDEGLAEFNLHNERRAGDLHKRINRIERNVARLQGKLCLPDFEAEGEE